MNKERITSGAKASALLVPAGMGLLFLLNVLVARFIGTEEYGKFSFVFFLTSITSLIGSLGFPMGAMRFVAAYERKGRWSELRSVVSFTLRASLGSSLIVSAVLLALAFGVATLAPHRYELILSALLTPCLAFWLWRRHVALGLHQTWSALFSREIATPLIVCIVTFVANVNSASTVILLFASATLITELLAFRTQKKVLGANVARSQLPSFDKRWISTSIPLSLVNLMQLGFNRWDVIVLGFAASAVDLGVYSAAVRLAFLGSLSLRIVNTFIAPIVSANDDDGKALRQILARGVLMSAVGGIPACALLFVFPEFFLSLFGDEFAKGATVLRVLTFAQLVNALTGPSGWMLSMIGEERLQAKIMFYITIPTILGCITLIPVYGVFAAAAISTSSACLLNIALYVTARRKIATIEYQLTV